jgi:carboxymethylenebutenolidase
MTFEERIAAGERIITRREALRLGVLVVSAPALGTLLAACHDDGGQASGGGPSPTASPDAEARMVTFAGPRGKLKAAYARATKPTGAVLVIHDNRGLTPHFVALPGRLAKAGYTALSVDLLSEEGGTAAIGGDARAQQALSAVSRERVVADLRAGVDELGRRAPGQKVGAMGFSLGAEMIWWLLDEPRLAAAVPIYGPFPKGADLTGAKAAVLAIYAEKDSQQVNATREAAEAALVLAGLKYELKFFLGVDNGFFDETGPRYDQRAADAAYSAVLDWFRIHLH